MGLLLSPPPLLLFFVALVVPATAVTTYQPNWNRLRGLARGRVEEHPNPVLLLFFPDGAETIPSGPQCRDAQQPLWKPGTPTLRPGPAPHSDRQGPLDVIDLWRMTAEPPKGGEGLRHRGHSIVVSYSGEGGALRKIYLTSERTSTIDSVDCPKDSEVVPKLGSRQEIDYHNLVMKHLPGADPELVLLNNRYEELERIPLSPMTREEINALVRELGFYRKAAREAQVPAEYLWAPAKAPERPDL
ncbi:Selenoprotein M [Fukomys damarensis]|uniref:Selenoprotein M n=1 Tax=Fukomys damarensis TaxID=885580 RepID=A0A091CY49_FUKDA|nr:Selenoprotein M [Fukomys damarensis]